MNCECILLSKIHFAKQTQKATYFICMKYPEYTNIERQKLDLLFSRHKGVKGDEKSLLVCLGFLLSVENIL